jgi:hypothetical protein
VEGRSAEPGDVAKGRCPEVSLVLEGRPLELGAALEGCPGEHNFAVEGRPAEPRVAVEARLGEHYFAVEGRPIKRAAVNVGMLWTTCGAAARICSRSAWVIGTPRALI